MDYLPIQRIGHGVSAIQCKETIARLIDKNIALEVCPSSNIALGLFKTLPEHPFQKIQQHGIQVSINSDDPPFFRTNLAKEYQLTQDTFAYSDADMNRITTMAIEAAFIDEKIKQMLRIRLS
jgi:adenosine deaminase